MKLLPQIRSSPAARLACAPLITGIVWPLAGFAAARHASREATTHTCRMSLIGTGPPRVSRRTSATAEPGQARSRPGVAVIQTIAVELSSGNEPKNVPSGRQTGYVWRRAPASAAGRQMAKNCVAALGNFQGARDCGVRLRLRLHAEVSGFPAVRRHLRIHPGPQRLALEAGDQIVGG